MSKTEVSYVNKAPEGNFLVGDQPDSKLVSVSYLWQTPSKLIAKVTNIYK
jgi:hypothetical protein